MAGTFEGLSDLEWKLFADLFPPEPAKRNRGMPHTPFRQVVNTLLYILITAPMGRPPIPVRIASRLITIPIVAGISYELMKLGARHYDHPLVKLLIAPGLALQRLTTREPDDSMLEVAIASLKDVLASERSGEDGPSPERT